MTETFRAIRDLKWLLVSVCALAVGTLAAHAQNPTPSQTPAAQRPAPAALPSPSPTPTPINCSEDPMLKRFVFRGIGPASMGGRIDDIAGVDSNPYVYYVGFATGGVWKTTNNGTTFQPIFDTYSRGSIGDIAIAPSNPDIVWVGTGEANNRQSSSFGDGIYKSTDGGKTWNNVKFIDEDTGFTDMVMDPSDSRTLYAASYQRRRTSWGFNGGGPGSGIWKTTDAGKNWTKLQGNGLPEGLMGRIGIDVSRSNPNVLYAQIEVGASTGTGGEEQTPPGGAGAASPTPTPTATPAASPTPDPTPPDPKKSGVWRSDD